MDNTLLAALMGILFGFVVLLVVFVIVIRSKLILLRNSMQSAWSDIEALLKKQYDLVPDLVEEVKGHAAHGGSVFERVSEARSAAMRASTPAESAAAENLFKDSLKGLYSVAGSYPGIETSPKFMQLQNRLKGLEDKIQYVARYYNNAVRELNVFAESFPSSLIASAFRFEKGELFELETTEDEGQSAKAASP